MIDWFLLAQVINSLKQDEVFILDTYTERQIDMSELGGLPLSNRDILCLFINYKLSLKACRL